MKGGIPPVAPLVLHFPCKAQFKKNMGVHLKSEFAKAQLWEPETPSFKIAKDPPLLGWECMGVHSTMERSPGQVLQGGMGVLGEGPGGNL